MTLPEDPAPHGSEKGEPPPSTGFLPISLALGLFVTGLFVLEIIPGLRCAASPEAPQHR